MARPSEQFTEYQPTTENYWRGIVLFGRNVASYKFALAKSLLEIAAREQEVVTLDELAEPFSRNICEHLKGAERQGTSSQSRFLDSCRAFNRGEIDRDELLATTSSLGFQNVIDAFHVVGSGPVPVRFFEDERRGALKGIRLTDEVHELARSHAEFSAEAESRWRLVETAWELNLPKHLLTVTYDPDSELFLPDHRFRRKAITGVRPALNGYQKGRCFYCFDTIGVTSGSSDLAQVDHFFPHVLKRLDADSEINLDGAWNLVLACRRCNGSGAKSANVPDLEYLARLSRRNEFLIGSHHPLRETLIAQTGGTAYARRDFLQAMYDEASATLLTRWQIEPLAPAAF